MQLTLAINPQLSHRPLNRVDLMQNLGEEISGDEGFDDVLRQKRVLGVLIGSIDVNSGLVVQSIVIQTQGKVVQDSLVGGVDL